MSTGILGDRFFKVADENADGFLDIKEFVNSLFKVYFSVFEDKAKFVFDIYDFDHDGLISKADARIIVSYFPEIGESDEEFKFSDESEDKISNLMFRRRLKNQEDIEVLLDHFFAGKGALNFEEFLFIVQNSCSDLFLSVMYYLRQRMPCTPNFEELVKSYAKKVHDPVRSPLNSAVKEIPEPLMFKRMSPGNSPRSNSAGSTSANFFPSKNNFLKTAAMLAKQHEKQDVKMIDAEGEHLDEELKHVAMRFSKLQQDRMHVDQPEGDISEVMEDLEAVRLPNQTLIEGKAAEQAEGAKGVDRFSSPSRFLMSEGAHFNYE